MMFVWDIIPLSGIVYRIAGRGDESRTCFTILKFIWKIDGLFCLTIFCQFVLVGLYYTAAAMQSYSSILQNDRYLTLMLLLLLLLEGGYLHFMITVPCRTWLSFNAYMQSILALHSVLNCSLIFRIKTILKKATSSGHDSGGGLNTQTSGRGGRWALHSIFSKKGRGGEEGGAFSKKAKGLKAFDKSNVGSGDGIGMHAIGSSFRSPALPSPTNASMKSPTFSSPSSAHSQVNLLAAGNRSTNAITTSEAENDGLKNMPTVFTTDDKDDVTNPDPLKNWKKQATKKVGVVGVGGSGSGPLSRHHGGSGSDIDGNNDIKNMPTINSNIVGDD